jgi:hypothetical protein
VLFVLSTEVPADIVHRLKGTLIPGKNEIVDASSGVTYKPCCRGSSDELVTDFGLVVRAPNPYASDRHLLMVFGTFGFGSWAGVRFLLSKQFQEANERLAGGFMECLVEAEIVKGAPRPHGPLSCVQRILSRRKQRDKPALVTRICRPPVRSSPDPAASRSSRGSNNELSWR